ncbi:MAG: hypothetical protein FHP92_12885 [Denitromonas halophila]|nr:MAG: hypothetical protein FHP92_12885 [Denitromonas halophila]
MAIYHCSIKPISRSKGRSAAAAAAYRAGEMIADMRTGETHDYSRKRGVAHAEIVTPPGCAWQPTRAELWNTAEHAERRRDACVAREHEVALPLELSDAQRLDLTRAYAADLAARHGCAVDFAIHEPRRDAPADQQNWHAHVLCTTRVVEGQGLGQKCDRERAGRDRRADLAAERQRWATLCNEHLAAVGLPQRIDHRSLADQGVDQRPTQHQGPQAAAIERSGRQPRRRRQRADRDSHQRAPVPRAERAEQAARRGLLQAGKTVAAERVLAARGRREQARDQINRRYEQIKEINKELKALRRPVIKGRARKSPLIQLILAPLALANFARRARLEREKQAELVAIDARRRELAEARQYLSELAKQETEAARQLPDLETSRRAAVADAQAQMAAAQLAAQRTMEEQHKPAPAAPARPPEPSTPAPPPPAAQPSRSRGMSM